MSTLPKGWAVATMDAVTAKPAQRIPDASERFVYIDIGSVDRDTKKITAAAKTSGSDAPSRARQVVKTGDVLVSMTRPNLNSVALVTNDLDGQIASTGFDVLRPLGLDPRWIFAAVRSKRFVDAMSTLVQGALYPAVRPRDVRGFELPLPPVAEQKRIADKLDALLARVDACKSRLDRIPTIVERFRQSVRAAAITGELTADWRDMRSERGVPTRDSLGEVKKREAQRVGNLRIRGRDDLLDVESQVHLPDGWSWISNHRLARDESNAICAGPFGTIFKAKDFRPAGIPIIFLRHVGPGEYRTHKPGFMDPDVWSELHRPYSIAGGELLVTKLGDPPGTACIYPHGLGPAMVTPDVMKMSVDSEVALPEYLMHYFNSSLAKSLVKKLSFGATRERIDLSLFKNFPVPLPPIDEQTEIVSRVARLFSFAEDLERRFANLKTIVEKLGPTLLAKAFRGELVPQDPNDEPAEKLLDRLKAQTDSLSATGKRGKRSAKTTAAVQ